MIGPDEARAEAGRRLATRLSAWAVASPDPPALSLGLRPPAERAVLADQGAAESWARSWSLTSLPEGARVEWEQRTWRRVGRQDIPVRLLLDHPGAVASFSGGPAARRWHVLSSRVSRLREAWAGGGAFDAAIRHHSNTLLSLEPSALEQVVGVVGWLAEHPARGLRPRQVPIRGVDTKWLTAHRALVTDLHAALTGSPELGLVDADRLVRVRLLDPTLALGAPRDLAAPVSDLAELDLKPRLVLVLENLESLLALPPWPGTVAVHGSGYAVDALAPVPWLHHRRVLYWGDLDSHGFAILHRLRHHVPHAVSVLMDVQTLLAHHDLWVPEPRPTRAAPALLTAAEQLALDRLRAEGDVRLEQERIPWTLALDALHRAADAT